MRLSAQLNYPDIKLKTSLATFLAANPDVQVKDSVFGDQVSLFLFDVPDTTAPAVISFCQANCVDAIVGEERHDIKVAG